MQLAIAPKGFPKASQEIAVPSLVMELREQVEALKPKPKEQERRVLSPKIAWKSMNMRCRSGADRFEIRLKGA